MAESEPLSIRRLASLPLPLGLSAEQVWALLTALRRPAAVHMPSALRNDRGLLGWYYVTRSMRADIAAIDRKCCRDSPLDRALQSQDSANFVADAHIAEALAALREDGVHLPRERAMKVMTRRARPASPQERVLRNCHDLIKGADERLREECTPDLLRKLHSEVTEGIPQSAPSLPPLVKSRFAPPAMDQQQALAYICASVNAPGITEADHPLICAFGVNYTYSATRPFGSWNGVMATLTARMLFGRYGVPALGFVPVFRLQRAWHDGALSPPAVPCTEEEASIDTGSDVDHTIWVAVMLRLVRRELAATEDAARHAVNWQATAISRLSHQTHLNHRQRAVLATALADPGRGFQIESHRLTHGVARASARSDLLGLVEHGYLQYEREGRAFVFSATPKLIGLAAHGSRRS